MNERGTYQNRKVVWIKYSEQLGGKMPKGDWVCLAMSNYQKPDSDKFDKFTQQSVKNGILEFKGHGIFGEILHDWFDETMVIMETMENVSEIDVMTTWHNNESLADSFWQCFFATCLPESTNYDNLKIVCIDLDETDRTDEFKNYLNRFENGWLPEN